MKELKTIHGETFLVEDGGHRGTTYKRLILGIESKMTLFKNDNPFDLRKENIVVYDTRSEFIGTHRVVSIAIGHCGREKCNERLSR